MPFIVSFTGGGKVFRNAFDSIPSLSVQRETGLSRVTLCDLDGDGKADIVAGNASSQQVISDSFALSIFRNTGTGNNLSFAAAIQLKVGTHPVGGADPNRLECRDMDNDGLPDIIIGGGPTYIFRNTSTPGNISFASSFSTNAVSGNGTFADMDNDGHIDIIGISMYGVNVTRNISTPGNLAFETSTVVVPFLLNMKSVEVADIDGDDKQDIILVNGSIWVYRNTSTGSSLSFAAGSGHYRHTDRIWRILAGDLDGNGKTDILGLDVSNNYCYKLTNQSSPGSFQLDSSAAMALATNPLTGALTDVNGDGKPDLIYSAWNGQPFHIITNTSSVGSISFAQNVAFAQPLTKEMVTAGDLNGDGKPELVFAHLGAPRVSVFQNGVGKPAITSFTPATATLGQTVSIHGDFLDKVTNVQFGGVAASSFEIVSPELIQAVVGMGASGKVAIKSPVGGDSLATFTFSYAPTISSFTPTSGVIGAEVVITGNFFTGATAVSFGGVAAASFTVNSSTQITAVLAGGATGAVNVTTPLGSGSLAGFSYTSAPVINSINPAKAAIGSTVTIAGSNFSSTAANNRVYFGPAQATVTAATGSSLTVTVPVGALYQPVSVLVNGVSGKSLTYFNPTSATAPDTLYSGSLMPKQDYPVGTLPGSVVTGDFDGDGKTDMIVANITNSFSIFRNTGTPANVSFAASSIATGNNMRKIVSGDINGDGKLDFVLVKHQTTAQPLVIFKNTSTPGNISFTEFVPVFPGQTPISVVIEDFDGDGRLDIASINDKTSTISLIRNTGDINTLSFATAQTWTLGNSAKNIRLLAGRLDADSRPDLVVLTSLGVSVFNNTSTLGNVQFGTETVYPIASGTTNRGIAAGDLNNDGLTDLALVYRSSDKKGKLGILRGTQNGNVFSFLPIDETTLARETTDLSIEDINMDGKPDLLMADIGANVIAVLRNKTSGSAITLAAPIDFVGTGAALTINTADFDGDGQTDLAVNYKDQPAVSVFRSNLQNATITGLSPTVGGPGTEVTITGVNFTNITGVYFGGLPAASYTVISATEIRAIAGEGNDGAIRVTSSTGESVFTGFTFMKPLITSFSPAFGPAGSSVTITGENFSTVANNNIVYFGAAKATVTGASTTSLTVTVPSGVSWQPITVTAFRSTAYSKAPFILSFGGTNELDSASFSARLELNSRISMEGVAVGDFNNDGNPDIAGIDGANNRIAVYANNTASGNLSFGSRINLATGNKPYALVVSDVNMDGKLDIVAGNSAANGGLGTVAIFVNNTTGSAISFEPALIVNGGTDATRLAVADFDGDKRPDIAFASTFTASVEILRNTTTAGTVGFVAINGPALTGKRALDIVATDLNNDGKAELVITDYYGLQANVYRNTSTTSISFAAAHPIPLYGYSLAVAAGDLDGDNLPDLVISKLKTTAKFALTVFKNASSGNTLSFIPAGDYDMAYEVYGLAITDINGDSKPDLLAANGTYNSRVSMFRNTSAGGISLANPAHYVSGTEPVRVLACDMNGDGRPDVVTANRISGSYTATGGVNILLNLLPPQANNPDQAPPQLALLSSPNPFTSSVTVRTGQSLNGARFTLTNMNGKVVRTQQYSTLPAGSSVSFGQSNLAPGLYFLMVESAQGRSIIKLMKQ